MAFSKTLRSPKALNRNPNFLYSFFREVTSAPPLPSSYFTLRTPLPFVHTGIYNRIPSPRFGPLFLSNPPWQLSQNSTPLNFPGELVKVGVTPLNLIHHRKLEFPTNEDLDRRKEEVRELEGFDGVFNWPNYISFGRMCSGPVLGWMILNEYYISSFVGLAISGATDWLDGFVARRMKINSVVGSYLDPLADKVLIVSIAIAMVKKDLLHSALVGLVVLRDVALVGGAVYNRASNLGWKWSGWYNFINLDAGRAEKVEPLFISKVNTVLQLTLIAAALLQPDLGNADTATYVQWLSWVVAMTTIASWAGYGVIYMRNGAGKLQPSTIRRKHNM